MTRCLLFAVLLLLAACGSDPPSAPGADARARLEAFFAAVRQGDPQEVASYVLYRGADALRHDRDLVRWSNEEERSDVDALMSRVSGLLAAGEPRFLAYETRGEGRGAWRIWTVAFGSAPDAPHVAVSLVEARGVLAVAEVEEVRSPTR